MTPEQEGHETGAWDLRPHVDGAQALAAAVAQIELAVREAYAPVERLGLLIDCMAETLRDLRTTNPPKPDADPDLAASGEVDWSIDRLQKDLYVSVTQLQFYDRMVQHLAHVQDYLTSVANELASPAATAGERDIWDEFRARLRMRLISAAQRELLDTILVPAAGTHIASNTARAEHASQGSVELF